MKILILKSKSLGDVILLTPLIRNLKENYPDSEIHLLLREGTEIAMTGNPYVDELIPFKKERSGFSNIKKIFNLVRKLRIRNYDIFISTDRGDFGAYFGMAINAKFRIGRTHNNKAINRMSFNENFYFQGERHIVDLNLDPLRILGKKINSKSLDIFYDLKESDYIKSRFLHNIEKFVHVHPVSQELYKSIDDKTFARIIDHLEGKHNFRCILTSGPSLNEINKVNNIIKLTKKKPLSLSGKLTFGEMVALNSFAALTIVVDTAVLHVATANDIPSVSFFGPTAVNNWGPWDKHGQINPYSKTGGCQSFGKHTVISKDYSCIPCSQIGCHNSGFSACLNYKKTEEILKIIDKKLQL